ncbi:MAG: hypothetical protein LBT87_08595 [Treponema sp.]|jgi:hypothetical protein|nr:hypothetical protein [Treponema sp.]
MSEIEEGGLARSHAVYARTVHVITIISAIVSLFVPILIMAFPEANVLNPNRIFAAIFSGAKPGEIWALSKAGGFPGAHFFLKFPGAPDAWAMFGINLGCSVGLWGLIPAIVIQIKHEKNYFEALAGIVLGLLVLLSMLGILVLEG